MHTKKTNNTNKLMQISYHFGLTKIQKLQNLKNNNNNKKKLFFCTGQYCPKLIGTAGIFSDTKGGVNRTGLLAGTVYTGRTSQYDTILTSLINI